MLCLEAIEDDRGRGPLQKKGLTSPSDEVILNTGSSSSRC